MKLMMMALMLSSTAVAGEYLSEAQVRETCLRNFARTISCTASFEGKTYTKDMDKETLKVSSINYYEHGVAHQGFVRSHGVLFKYPYWKFKCDPKTGALQGTELAVRNRIDTEHTAKSVCR